MFARDASYRDVIAGFNSPYLGNRGRFYTKATIASLQPGKYMQGTVFDEIFELLRRTFPSSNVSMGEQSFYTAVSDRLGIVTARTIKPSAMKQAVGNWIINKCK